MANEKIISLLKKLNELAKRGVGGEQRNAERMLKDLLKKHSISLEDIEGDVKTRREFKIRNEQSKFFGQIVASVIGNQISVYYRVKEEKNVYGHRFVTLTDAEFIEISAKFDFYWKKYQEDLEIFYSAFIQKNRLFSKPDENKVDDAEEKESTLEEQQRIFRMRQMMDGLNKHNFQKQLNQ